MAVLRTKEVSLTGKSKYEQWIKPEGLLKIEGWARDGLIDVEIAKMMEINPDTLYGWKKKFPQIAEALKKGKDVIDRQVENSLLRRALGYEYEEVKEVYKDDKLIEKTIIKKAVIPDTTAQIFWLKNRKPDKWRDKPEVMKSGDTSLFEGIIRAVGGKFDTG